MQQKRFHFLCTQDSSRALAQVGYTLKAALHTGSAGHSWHSSHILCVPCFVPGHNKHYCSWVFHRGIVGPWVGLQLSAPVPGFGALAQPILFLTRPLLFPGCCVLCLSSHSSIPFPLPEEVANDVAKITHMECTRCAWSTGWGPGAPVIPCIQDMGWDCQCCIRNKPLQTCRRAAWFKTKEISYYMSSNS